jgi:uncharacterized protein YyaL (SSP411 family)
VHVRGVEAADDPLLADRSAINGSPTAYVCRGFVCNAPTQDVDDLVEQLRS